MYSLDGNGIRNMIYGATIFGGGGGGACESGEAALEQFKEDHGIQDDADVMVQVMSPDEMDEAGYAACTAAMGAPTKFKEVRIAPYINGSFEHLCKMADSKRKSIDYSIAVEIGGFNTLVPLLVAMEKGIPFIDADGTGRAVPALDTLLLHINGLQTSPLAMSDNMGNRVAIELENARDAIMGETIGRNLCVAFNQMGGLSGWMVKKTEITGNLPVGSVTKCCKVGEILRNAKTSEGIFDAMAAAGLECREIGRGLVKHATNEQASGFDKGTVEIIGADGTKWTTHYLNENLIIQEQKPGCAPTTVMTAPDIICYIDTKTCKPLSNADIVGKNGDILVENVAVGILKVDEKWWRNDMAYLQKIWSRYFNILEMPEQQIIKYDEVK